MLSHSFRRGNGSANAKGWVLPAFRFCADVGLNFPKSKAIFHKIAAAHGAALFKFSKKDSRNGAELSLEANDSTPYERAVS